VADRSPGKIQCDADNAEITLPPGFCALVVADLTQNGAAAPARHMAIMPNGDIFVAINSPRNVQPAFGIMGLRDHDGDWPRRSADAIQSGFGRKRSGVA
jgi:hypothetical protein